MLTVRKDGRVACAMVMTKPVDECHGVVQCGIDGCEAYIALVVDDDYDVGEQIANFLKDHDCDPNRYPKRIRPENARPRRHR